MSKRPFLKIPELSARDKERFAAMVNTEPGQGPGGDCHVWQGAITSDGYGTISIGDRTYFAHRVALKLATGNDPGQMLATHQCDHRPCVNPDHLKPGTNQSNMLECVARGRWRNGAGKRKADRPNPRINPNTPDARHTGRTSPEHKLRPARA